MKGEDKEELFKVPLCNSNPVLQVNLNRHQLRYMVQAPAKLTESYQLVLMFRGQVCLQKRISGDALSGIIDVSEYEQGLFAFALIDDAGKVVSNVLYLITQEPDRPCPTIHRLPQPSCWLQPI